MLVTTQIYDRSDTGSIVEHYYQQGLLEMSEASRVFDLKCLVEEDEYLVTENVQVFNEGVFSVLVEFVKAIFKAIIKLIQNLFNAIFGRGGDGTVTAEAAADNLKKSNEDINKMATAISNAADSGSAAPAPAPVTAEPKKEEPKEEKPDNPLGFTKSITIHSLEVARQKKLPDFSKAIIGEFSNFTNTYTSLFETLVREDIKLIMWFHVAKSNSSIDDAGREKVRSYINSKPRNLAKKHMFDMVDRTKKMMELMEPIHELNYSVAGASQFKSVYEKAIANFVNTANEQVHAKMTPISSDDSIDNFGGKDSVGIVFGPSFIEAGKKEFKKTLADFASQTTGEKKFKNIHSPIATKAVEISSETSDKSKYVDAFKKAWGILNHELDAVDKAHEAILASIGDMSKAFKAIEGTVSRIESTVQGNITKINLNEIISDVQRLNRSEFGGLVPDDEIRQLYNSLKKTQTDKGKVMADTYINIYKTGVTNLAQCIMSMVKIACGEPAKALNKVILTVDRCTKLNEKQFRDIYNRLIANKAASTAIEKQAAKSKYAAKRIEHTGGKPMTV